MTGMTMLLGSIGSLLGSPSPRAISSRIVSETGRTVSSARSPRPRGRQIAIAAGLAAAWVGILSPSFQDSGRVQAQAGAPQALTLDADIQEANAKTGVVTARGNVRLNYPARQIEATAAQAQYFSQERRIVMTGDVLVLQSGTNSIRGEVVTYLIDEGRFVALPQASQQVRSVYTIVDPNPAPAAPAAP